MFSGSTMGSLTYAHAFERFGTVSFGFHFMNYGRFEEYDEEENHLGTFTAGDYGLCIGWGMWLDSNFSVGANFKPVLSQYESYTAFAILFDVAGSYVSDNRSFAATLMARNIGAQIITFDETVENLPFELSAEVSYKLQNAPFRLFVAATELQHWNLRYDDPLNPTTTTDPFTGEQRYHSGIDIDGYGNDGAPVVASDGGTVITATYNDGYGNYIIIDHGNGYQTLYAHMSGLAVGNGATVSKGQTIGYLGATGRATGTHCHFEVFINGSRTDPAQFFGGLTYYNC